MSDKFEEFMKKNIPAAEGALNPLELSQRKNWLPGIAASGLLAASLAITLVNRTPEYDFSEDEISLEDEFPTEYQETEKFFEEI